MYNTARSGTLNGNKGGTRETRPQPATGRKSLGNLRQNASPLGTGSAPAARPLSGNASAEDRHLSRGGQASLSLFGIAGSGRARWADARRQESKATGTEVAPEAEAPPSPRPPAPRVVNGQTYSHRARRYSRGIHAAAIEAGQADTARTAGQEPSPLQQDLAAAQVIAPAAGTLLAMPRCWQSTARTSDAVTGIPVTVASPAPLRLKLSRDWLAVFATLATVEQRPVVEVIEECLADIAAHLARTRHSLRLDAEDTAALNAYLDSLERQEREEDEASARLRTTPAMRQAGAAADERERHPLPDLEEWDRTLPFGAVELALAID